MELYRGRILGGHEISSTPRPQVWHLERKEPQAYWFKVEFLLQWQHMKGISWLWKLPLAGNRKCKSILRFTASNFRYQ
ncbi:hypothetical protein JHK86_010226 [Glycine max]|nr:hypothetical protein JHK86_010226 [Glycine max]